MAMDPVNKKALKKDFDDRADKDIDNDGDTDSSDEYLHKRRKAISKAIGKVKESVAVFESHFKVGDEVECIKSGMEGKVIEVDPEEKGKYYTVKREDGKIMKYAPDELRAEDEDDDDEDEKEDMNEDIRRMSHGRLKWHMNTGTPHGSYSNAEMKAERDRRMKFRDSADAYRKAKPGLSEEVEDLDERFTRVDYKKHGKTFDNLRKKAQAKVDKESNPNYKSSKKEEAVLDEVLDTPEKMDRYKAKAKSSRDRAAKSAVATNLRSKNAGQREHPAKDLKTMAKRTAGLRMADKAAMRKTFKALRKEEIELDETKKYGPGHIGAIQRMLDKEREAKKAKGKTKKESFDLEEKLKVSDGMGTWIDDFKKSDAPQFKGKSDKERREMAIAAYLSAKRSGR